MADVAIAVTELVDGVISADVLTDAEGGISVGIGDTAVIAIGNGPHPLIPQTTKELDLHRWGNIVADPETGQTSKVGVFAGGDIVTGAATVIEAMGAGKRAAAAIDAFLNEGAG